MKTQRNLGIWMDHENANLIDLDAQKQHRSITCKFTFDTKEEALNRSENLMHNKRQQMHKAYYKEIADIIFKYDSVLIFGPTNAKTELHNHLNKDLHFKDIAIQVQAADKMTDNEKDAFVRNYFSN